MINLLAEAAKLVGKGLTPEEQAEVPANFAAMGKIEKEKAEGLGSRQQLYNSLMNRGSEIDQKQAQLLEQINTDKPLSNSQVASMLLIGLMPMVAGGAIKGKQGVAAGAAAGALGTQVMSKGFEDTNERARKRGEAQFDLLSKEKVDVNKQANDALMSQFDAQDKFAIADANNAATMGAAAIRASGESQGLKAIGQQLGNVAKQLDINREQAEKGARNQGFEIDDKVYSSSGAVTDDGIKEVKEKARDYEQVLRGLKKMVETSNAAEMGILSRVNPLSKTNDKLETAREALKPALTRLERAPGAMNDTVTKIIDNIIADPTGFLTNTKDLLGGMTIEERFKDLEAKMTQDFAGTLTVQGMNYEPIGSSIVDKATGQKLYLYGAAPGGKKRYTTNVDLVNQKLQMFGKPLIK